MQLKCVGGPLDGDTVFVHDTYRVGDCIRIPDGNSVDYHLYQLAQVRTVCPNARHFMLLKDTFMSDAQALECLIKNHG